MTDRFVFVDIETTGLQHETDLVMEIGVIITDLELETIDMYDTQIWESPFYDRKWESVDPFVQTMHHGNGLLEQCRSEGQTQADAEETIADFLRSHGVKDEPMCGSSVHFDRLFLAEQYPSVEDLFSHRNIDVSTLKELCMRLNPDLYAKLADNAPKRERHRVIEDIEDTIGELKFYRDNFLFIP
jgi:oligoribonuclease